MNKKQTITKVSTENANNGYQKPTITKLEKSQVEIVGSIPAEVFESFRKKALQNINDEITIDGFRKGKVPENVLLTKVGAMTILEEMAQLALSKEYPTIVSTEKIDAIGHPEIQITKIAAGNPLEYKITTAVVPDVKLESYSKLAQEIRDGSKAGVSDVSEKEIDDAILNIRRSRANHSEHDHAKLTKEEHDKLVDAALPEFNDDFVKSLGQFKDIADFKEKVKTMLADEKKTKEKDKRRVALSDKLIDAATIDIPDLLVNSELRRIEAQFNDDIQHMGVKLEDYLNHAKKTIEDLRKEWRPLAEKKAKLQLILNTIADKEKITVTPEEVEQEMKLIVEHYKDADREHAAVYATTVLTNEKVFQFLGV